MKLAYYPGCVSRSTGKEMDLSTKAVCSALGVELEELSDWSCCGATHVPSELVSVGLAVRNMIQTDLPIVTSCSICYSNLRNAVQRMGEPDVRSKVNAVLSKSFNEVQIRHVLDVILEVLQKDDDRLIVPLKDLKVAPYYGCLLTRPKGGMDSPEYPQIMDKLLKILKAESIDFRLKAFCCGGPIFMPQEEAAAKIAHMILTDAKKAGAQVIVTFCPLCHLMLDARQRALEQKFGEKIGIPVLYLTQLVGIALGLGPDELGLGLNSVSPMAMVEEIYGRMVE
jgi:heterodisulfide reductase subunit B2